jgi:hypothetical protein
MLGLEDVTLGNSALYQTTAIVSSQDLTELYMIDRDVFANILKSTNIWPDLTRNSLQMVNITS